MEITGTCYYACSKNSRSALQVNELQLFRLALQKASPTNCFGHKKAIISSQLKIVLLPNGLFLRETILSNSRDRNEFNSSKDLRISEVASLFYETTVKNVRLRASLRLRNVLEGLQPCLFPFTQQYIHQINFGRSEMGRRFQLQKSEHCSFLCLYYCRRAQTIPTFTRTQLNVHLPGGCINNARL